MQTEPNAKQQIVEKIKSSANILVTVGNNPTVDELSAALALTFMLDRMDKHVTAVFSGSIPPAITFLEPEKTFENTVDSLRDFIIALDKEKADRLRYKVEDDVVRIFITPFKTVLSEKDLQFSQGDFNVELIIALGVKKREDLDTAITAHGRILHDAAVMTVNIDGSESSLGTINWYDNNASGYSEMLVSLSEALQSGLLDQQIATALLTGIVSATDRFRNERTSPKVMTMSAQLMSAGANQQLIAEKLDKTLDQSTTEPGSSEPKDTKKENGELEIHHDAEADAPTQSNDGEEALKKAEDELEKSTAKNTVKDEIKVEDNEATSEKDQTTSEPQIRQEHRTWKADNSTTTPSFGGTLNATASDAEEDNRREEQSNVNKTLLSHEGSLVGAGPQQPQPDTAEPETHEAPETPILSQVYEAPDMQQNNSQQDTVSVDLQPSDTTASTDTSPGLPSADDLQQSHSDGMLQYEPAPISGLNPTLADLDEQTRGKATEEARAAVDAVLNNLPFDPAHEPLQSSGALPGVEVFHGTPAPQKAAPSQPVQTQPPVASSAAVPAGLPTPPPLPPLPDFSTLPPIPEENAPTGERPIVDQPIEPVPATPQATQPVDPGQFRIPGQ